MTPDFGMPVRALRHALARARGALRRNHDDDELACELAAHVEMATDEYIRRGMTPEAARRVALAESGGIEVAKEAYRDQRGIPRVESLIRSLTFAWRGLRRSPGYAIPVVVSLALGIGLNTAIFTMMQNVLLRPLPYLHEEDLVTPGRTGVDRGLKSEDATSFTDTYGNDYDAWKASSRTLESIAMFTEEHSTIEGNHGAEYTAGSEVTPNLLRVLGTTPMRGRWFAEDEARASVAVVSEDLWTRQYDRDSNVVGRTLHQGGNTYTIIGVMKRGTALPLNAQYWTPSGSPLWGQVVARKRPTASLAMVATDLNALSPSVRNLNKAGHNIQIVAMSLHEELFGSARPAVRLLAIAAALLFLIACANITNLALARMLNRRREFAVRAALGAGRSSLGALVLSENVLLATGGAVAGLAVGYWGSRLFAAFAPEEVTRVHTVAFTFGSALFAFALAIVAACAVSLVPVMSVTSKRVNPTLTLAGMTAARGRGLERVRHTLVTGQLALTLCLMTCAGLLVRSVGALTRQDHLGFSPHGIVTASLMLFGENYRDEMARSVFTSRFEERIKALPGVIDVTIGQAPLTAGTGSGVSEGFDSILGYVDSTNTTARPYSIWVKNVGVRYVPTFGIRLLSGRNFQRGDDAHSQPVAILNETAAALFFPGVNPLGRTLTAYRRAAKGRPLPIVVGVIADMLQRDPTMAPNPEVLVPAVQQQTSGSIALSVRSAASPAATIRGIRDVLKSLDPRLAPTRLQTMDDVVKTSMERHNFLQWLLMVFAILALSVSVLGLYAVISYLVSQRTVEIGVRVALGAQQRDVFALVMREGISLVLFGACTGSAVAFALTRLLERFLYGVTTHDVFTFVVGPVLLATVALAATCFPALRASKLDAALTLRAD